jgi:hypothetical protein
MATAAKPQNITPDQKSFGARILMFPLTPSAPPPDDQIGKCPDSDVRIIVQQPLLRTSESKDTSNLLI